MSMAGSIRGGAGGGQGFTPDQIQGIFAQARLACDASKAYHSHMLPHVDHDEGGGPDELFGDLHEHQERAARGYKKKGR